MEARGQWLSFFCATGVLVALIDPDIHRDIEAPSGCVNAALGAGDGAVEVLVVVAVGEVECGEGELNLWGEGVQQVQVQDQESGCARLAEFAGDAVLWRGPAELAAGVEAVFESL